MRFAYPGCAAGSSRPKAVGHPLRTAADSSTLNHMVQHSPTHFSVSFAALADATRRGVLDQLARGDASITDLADKFDMTLTGMKKHVGVLELAGLVTTEKDWVRLPPEWRTRVTAWPVRARFEDEAALDRLSG